MRLPGDAGSFADKKIPPKKTPDQNKADETENAPQRRGGVYQKVVQSARADQKSPEGGDGVARYRRKTFSTNALTKRSE